MVVVQSLRDWWNPPKEPLTPYEEDHRLMIQYRNLLLPGMRRLELCDPFHPVYELDMWVDRTPRIVLQAVWKDGSTHYAYLTPVELRGAQYSMLFMQRLDEICPRTWFNDEAVVAFDDPEYWS